MNTNQLLKKINELSQFNLEDFKNINYKDLLANLIKRKDTLINIILIVGTIIAIPIKSSKISQEIKDLKVEIQLAQERLETTQQLETLETELTQFYANFPVGLQIEQLIARLNEFAVNNNIQILSLAPGSQTEKKYHDIVNVSLSIRADTYIDLWRFMKNIETSQFAIRTDSLQSSKLKKSRLSSQSTDKDSTALTGNLNLSSIQLKRIK